MDKDQRIAFLNAQTACMYAELEAMKAKNLERQANGEALAYGADAFRELPENYGISYNQATEFLLSY